MSTYGVAVFGQSTFGARVNDTFAPHTLHATCTQYGTVALSWDLPPGSWSSIRLVRNSSGNPVDVNDGDVVYTDAIGNARTSYADSGLTMGRFYYYRQFVLPLKDLTTPAPAVGQWVPTGSAQVLTVQYSGAIDRLYSRLPEWYRDESTNSLAEKNVDTRSTFLYRFLAPMGFHLESLRTDTEHLLKSHDALSVSETLLPALGASLGVPYEPVIGARAMRRLVNNAARIWQVKGTLTGIRELTSVVTGYGSHVRIGQNLVLDNGDAGPLGASQWTLDPGVQGSVAYEPTPSNTTPWRDGLQRITFPSGSTGGYVRIRGSHDLIFDGMDDLLELPARERMQRAIPVIPQLAYSMSIVVANDNTSGTAVSVWPYVWPLDETGARIGASPVSVSYSVPAGGTPQTLGLDVPLSAARYIEPGLLVNGIPTQGVSLRASNMVVAERTANYNTPPQPSREILIYLDALLKNWVTNTDGSVGTGVGWTPNVVSRNDPTYGQYLTTQDVGKIGHSDVMLDDGLMVAADAAAVPPVEPTKTLDPDTLRFLGAQVPAEPGATWTVMAEVLDPDFGAGQRTGQIGFEYYDGTDLIAVDYGPRVNLAPGVWYTLSHEMTVPRNATFSSIMIVVLIPGGSAQSTALRKVTWVNTPASQAFFFDGSTPSLTGDFLWQGIPGNSPSYYYPRRAPKIDRLSKMLNSYVPDPARYHFIYGVDYDQIPDSPRAVAGSDINPSFSPLDTVRATRRARWGVTKLVGIGRSMSWEVYGTPVGTNRSVRWNTLIKHPAPYTTVDVDRTTIWNDLVYVQVGIGRTIQWSDNELIMLDDVLGVNGGDASGGAYSTTYNTPY